jgi:hypothetical protein
MYRKFLLYLTILIVGLLLTVMSVRWVPTASAQGLVEYAIILALVQNADCSVKSYSVQAPDEVQITELVVRGAKAREEGMCALTVQGRLRQVDPVHSFRGIKLDSETLVLREYEGKFDGKYIVVETSHRGSFPPAGGYSHQLVLILVLHQEDIR